MITPAPTTRIDSRLCRGVLEQVIAPSGDGPGHVVISIPDTSYQLRLVADGAITARVGHRIVGKIGVKARRIDVVTTGGRYVEPVSGHPRRVQGTIIAVEGDRVVVNAAVPIWCEPTDPRQSASGFEKGQFVSFDALDGATFTQQS